MTVESGDDHIRFSVFGNLSDAAIVEIYRAFLRDGMLVRPTIESMIPLYERAILMGPGELRAKDVIGSLCDQANRIQEGSTYEN